MQVQRLGSIPILCVNINITIDTMLKFDANVNIDAQCKWTLKPVEDIALTHHYIFFREIKIQVIF